MARCGWLAILAVGGMVACSGAVMAQVAAPTPGDAASPRTDGFQSRTSGFRTRIGSPRPRVSGIRPDIKGVRPDVRGVRPGIKGVNPGRPRDPARDREVAPLPPAPSPVASTGGGASVGGNAFSPDLSSRDRLTVLLQNERTIRRIGNGVVAIDPVTGAFSSGGGVSVTGVATGDRGFLGIGISSGASSGSCVRAVGEYIDRFRRWEDRCDTFNEPIYGTEVMFDPEALSMGAQPVLSQDEPVVPAREVVDLARDAARGGELARAIELYRTHLGDNSGDAGAMRELAIVLLLDRRDEDGVAMMLMAYRTMPEMGGFPARLGDLGIDTPRARSLVQRQVARAHRIGASADFLSAAALMQAMDRAGPALRMIEKAEAAGLDAAIVGALRAQLDPPAA